MESPHGCVVVGTVDVCRSGFGRCAVADRQRLVSHASLSQRQSVRWEWRVVLRYDIHILNN